MNAQPTFAPAPESGDPLPEAGSITLRPDTRCRADAPAFTANP